MFFLGKIDFYFFVGCGVKGWEFDVEKLFGFFEKVIFVFVFCEFVDNIEVS